MHSNLKQCLMTYRCAISYCNFSESYSLDLFLLPGALSLDVWNQIKETSFKMESSGQKGTLSHPTAWQWQSNRNTYLSTPAGTSLCPATGSASREIPQHSQWETVTIQNSCFPPVNLKDKTFSCFTSKNRFIWEGQRIKIWVIQATAEP